MNSRLAKLLKSKDIRGGVNTSKSERFFSGGLHGISVTILAVNHYAGVVEVYEEDKQIRSEPFKGQEGEDSET